MITFKQFLREDTENWHTRHPKEPRHKKEAGTNAERALSLAHQAELQKRGLKGSQGPFSQHYDGKKYIEKTYLDGGGELHSTHQDGKITHQLTEAKKDRFTSTNFYKGSDTHHGHAAKVANQSFKKAEYHEDEHGNRVRKWRDGEESTHDDVHHWLRGNRVIEDLKSGLEHVKPHTIAKLVSDAHLKKEPHAAHHCVTHEAAEKYNLPAVMGKKFPKAKDIPDKKVEPQKAVATASTKHDSDVHDFKHALAKIKANKTRQTIHVVHNTRSGNVESIRKPVFDSYKDKSHYKILKTHTPDKK